MADKLTWDEIKRQYPDEYVILVDYDFDDNEDVAGGIVIAHARDRDAVYDQCQQSASRPNQIAVRYTGEIKGGIVSFLDLDEAD